LIYSTLSLWKRLSSPYPLPLEKGDTEGFNNKYNHLHKRKKPKNNTPKTVSEKEKVDL